MKSKPDFSFETAAMARGHRVIAGVDEVGRGPMAGPVTAAAVILDPHSIPTGLNDSKQLSKGKRETLYAELLTVADVSVAHATVEEIDAHNILRASHIAMVRAIKGLKTIPDHILIDGNMIPNELLSAPEAPPVETLIKGDTRSQSISAASIAAKVCRDRVMWDLAQHYPGYGWETNQGYPSKSHKLALQNLGVTPHHRRSFKPVYNMLYQDKSVSY